MSEELKDVMNQLKEQVQKLEDRLNQRDLRLQDEDLLILKKSVERVDNLNWFLGRNDHD